MQKTDFHVEEALRVTGFNSFHDLFSFLAIAPCMLFLAVFIIHGIGTTNVGLNGLILSVSTFTTILSIDSIPKTPRTYSSMFFVWLSLMNIVWLV